MKKPRMRFIVTVDAPFIHTKPEAAEYIRDAVRAWGGQRHPDDEFFDHFRNATVKVHIERKPNG
jgi:hypothetical protein